jgi:hypothetical protein
VFKCKLVLTLEDAKEKIELWRTEYNGFRPHSSLEDRNPQEVHEKMKNKPDLSTLAVPFNGRRSVQRHPATPAANQRVGLFSGHVAKICCQEALDMTCDQIHSSLLLLAGLQKCFPRTTFSTVAILLKSNIVR